MRTEAFRCADASEARAEPLFGTASHVRRWLLLEQPGAWGSDALSHSRLPQRVAAEMVRRTRAAGIRMVLIRRGTRFSTGHRQCYFARTEVDATYLAHVTLNRLDDLLDIDLEPLAGEGTVAEAAGTVDPVFLVCTHGRHDACCSIRGNQVSRVACARDGADAWECSHIGGDRFAANIVCFPHGIYYGRVGPESVGQLIDGYARGVLRLEHYRGRCCYPFPLQAAEYFVRRESGLLGVDDLRLAATSRTSNGLDATFDLPEGGKADVTIRVDKTAEPHRLTCGSPATAVIPRYELVDCALV